MSTTSHYDILGLNSSATPDEIRRAYRILARRYHPDLNPGKPSEDKFKAISQAYETLSDPEKRKAYDAELDVNLRGRINLRFDKAGTKSGKYRTSARQRYRQAQEAQFARPKPPDEPKWAEPKMRPKGAESNLGDLADRARKWWQKVSPSGPSTTTSPNSTKPGKIVKISVVEVSVTLHDAIFGVKKTVEIGEPEGLRKVSVSIPPGVRNGSVVHLRSRGGMGEDLVVIVRVANHPFLSIQNRGLVIELPVTLNEAISGASISVPTFDDPIILKIPPGSHSGTELRIKEKGILQKDGSRGDLFARLMIHVPEYPDAVGLKDKAQELDRYYQNSVRENLPQNLSDI